MKALTLKILALSFLLHAVAAYALDLGRKVEFNVPPQPLASAVLQFSRQAEVQLLAPGQKLDGVGSRGVQGRYSIDEGLKVLLEGTGFNFKVVGDNTISLTFASAAADQSLNPPTSTPPKPAADNAAVRQEGIIVTATKRAERMQDVPISITAVGAEEIERRGLFNAADYLRGMPGVTQTESLQGQQIVLRGMESVTRDQNFTSGPTTATYFGETPTTNTAGIQGGSNVDIKLVDIERVEVLRGPQGTAFGNSSMGGAVRVIPVEPKLDLLEGKLSAGYSSTSGNGGNNYNFHAVGNIPLINDKVAIRAVVYQSEDSGYYRNQAASDPAFRSSFVTPFGAQNFVRDKDSVGDARVLGGRIAALFRASDDLRFTLSYLNQKTETDGFGISNNGSYLQRVPLVAPQHVIRGEESGVFDTHISIANGTMEYDFGRAKLTATYSHTRSGIDLSFPFTISVPSWAVSTVSFSPHREDVGEIRLASQLDGPWNFLGGVYYEDLKDEATANYLWFGDPATNNIDRTGAFDPGRRQLGDRRDTRHLVQKAAFGEVSWELLKGLTLTGGVRAYNYVRGYTIEATGAFYGAAGIHEQRSVNVSNTNYRANLSYKPSNNALVYAGYSQGYRLGRPQGGLPSVCDANNDGIADVLGVPLADTVRVNPDSVDSYEVGGKFTLLDRRLSIDAAAYRMNWSDFPLRFGATAGCPFTFNANVGEARTEGVEVQTNIRLSRSVKLVLGGSYVNAKVTSTVPRLNVVSGQRLPGTPKINGNLGLEHEWSFGNYRGFLRADAIYVGEFYDNLAQTPATRAGGYVKTDVVARIGTGHYYVDLFARNLTNEDAYTARSTGFANQLRPRTVGFQLGYNF